MSKVFGNADQETVHSQWHFKHLTVDQGLSNNFVYSICQDKKGYMWVATSYGLNKYNGSNVRKFFHDKQNPSSLNSNFISSLFIDSDSNLWIGTDKGIHLYNDTQESFIQYPLPDGHQEREIFAIAEDKNHKLLIGASTGLYISDIKQKQFEKVPVKEYGAEHDSIYRMVVDKENNLWMSCYQQGLYYFNRQTKTIEYYTAQKLNNKSLSDNWIACLYIDSEDVLWIGTYNSGICRYNPSGNNFTRFVIDPDYEFTKRIRTIFEDRFGRMFIGSRDGLFLFDRKTAEFSLYALNTHLVSVLSENSVTYSYLDNQGGLWLGTHSGGVNYIDMYEKPFNHYKFSKDDNRFLNNGSIHCFNETNDKLYVGTHHGINVLDKSKGTFTYIKNIPGNPNSLSYDDVKSIAVENENRIWVATNRGGVQVFDSENNVVKTFKATQGQKGSLPSNKVYNVFCDNKQRIWVISNCDWDREQSLVSRYISQSNSFKTYKNDFFMGFYQAPDSTLLVGGYYGFFQYNESSDDFTAFANDSLIFRTMTIYRDSAKNVWVGNSAGLCKFINNTGVFEDISSKVSLNFEEVYGILENKGDLWVSTNNGLLVLNNIYADSSTCPVQYFDKNDGLQSREFNYNAYYQALDSSFYFGGDNGFNHFYPDRIKKNPFIPIVNISLLQIAGKTVHPFDTVNGEVLLTKSIGYTDKLKVKYNSGAIKLGFDVLHYSNKDGNGFKFMLKGQDNRWYYTYVPNNSVTYHKLNPGKYTFIVYGINADGVESNLPATIDILIKPPFLRTAGFKICLLLGMVFLVFFIIHARTRYLRKQRIVLERKVEEKSGELITSYKELKERQEEIIWQNEEIRAQRDTINEKNILLEEYYKKAIELNELGNELTLSHDIDSVLLFMYHKLRNVVEYSFFGIGFVEDGTLNFKYLIEEGNIKQEIKVDLNDKAYCSVQCYHKNKTIIVNKQPKEDRPEFCAKKFQLSFEPKSLIYVPLNVKSDKVGVMTLQSEKENIFLKNDIPIIQSIATFIANAYDNSKAYRLIEKQNSDLENHRIHLEEIVAGRTRALQEQIIKAEESDKLKTAFLANMSHEIRTPLNAIIGFIDILYESNTDKMQKKYFEIIRKSSFSLMNLIEDIIDFSRIESGVVDIALGPTNIYNLLGALYGKFHSLLKDSNESFSQDVKLVHENSIEIPYNEVNTDSLRLEQIFSNLLSNAVKFTHKGEIRFGIHALEGNKLTFYVSDTGIGIPKEDIEIIFERFMKLEHKTENLYRGGGLGLSISKNLVEILGGTIWLESEVNKGTTFFFTVLNVKEGDGNTLNLSSGMPVKTKICWSKKTVLIVEDEISNFQLLKAILKPTQINLIYAQNGEEGVRMFRENQQKIDIVLMDIKMPLLNGFDASEKIKTIQKNIPIIAQTAYAAKKDRLKIEKSVMDDFVVKPINAKELLGKISNLIS